MKVIEKDISVEAISCHGAPVSKTFSSSDTGNVRPLEMVPSRLLPALLASSHLVRRRISLLEFGEELFFSRISEELKEHEGSGSQWRTESGLGIPALSSRELGQKKQKTQLMPHCEKFMAVIFPFVRCANYLDIIK